MPSPSNHAEIADVSNRVVEKVADAHSMSPIDLSPPLYDVLDPDALNALFQPGRENVLEVTFEYHGCAVAVDHSGDVTVEPSQQVSASDARIDGGNEPQEVD